MAYKHSQMVVTSLSNVRGLQLTRPSSLKTYCRLPLNISVLSLSVIREWVRLLYSMGAKHFKKFQDCSRTVTNL